MTVNHPSPPGKGRVGRPSMAAERRTAILMATANVVARDGVAETTVAKVADEAHMQRTLVLHYFGDRASLLEAFVDQVVGFYGDLQLLSASSEPLEQRLDAAFDAGFYARREDLVVWSELVALAAREATVRRRLRALWQTRWLPLLEEEVARAFPAAERARVAAVAYGIASLVEAHWSLHLQGLDEPERRAQAKAMARLLVGSLRGGAARARSGRRRG